MSTAARRARDAFANYFDYVNEFKYDMYGMVVKSTYLMDLPYMNTPLKNYELCNQAIYKNNTCTEPTFDNAVEMINKSKYIGIDTSSVENGSEVLEISVKYDANEGNDACLMIAEDNILYVLVGKKR